jgi:protein O-GlcNAc transferase
VDVDRFLRELPERFEDFPASELPRDPRFREVLEAVPGLACANNLALLNVAAACLEPGECYAEAGTYRGTSLISAMLDNDGKEFVAIDNFSMGDGSREQLEENLRRYGLEGRATIVEGDVFEVLRGVPFPSPVGVWYYDAGHEYEQQVDGLQLAERHLSERALMIVDDSDWDRVARAIEDYLAEQPRAKRILSLPGKDKGGPHWWEGVDVLEWRRS